MKRFFAFILFTSFIAAAPFLNFQGRLSSPAGTPLNGSFSFMFTIYNVESGGVPLWSESQTLEVLNGVFNANLGTTSALTLSFNEDYWVEISSNGQVFNQRVRLTTSPYAFIANKLTSQSGPIGANDLVKKAGDTMTGSLTIQNGNLTIVGTNQDVKVGIGTNAPVGTLDVESSNTYGAIQGQTTGVGGVGVRGYSTGSGSIGVYGNTPNGYGVYGVSTSSYGVVGTSVSANGVYGYSVNSYGVYGQTGNAASIGVLAYGPSSGYARLGYSIYSLHGDGSIYTGGDITAGANMYAGDVYLRGIGKWASTLVNSCQMCVYTIPGGNPSVCPPAGEHCAPVNQYTPSIWANQACYFMWKLKC